MTIDTACRRMQGAVMMPAGETEMDENIISFEMNVI